MARQPSDATVICAISQHQPDWPCLHVLTRLHPHPISNCERDCSPHPVGCVAPLPQAALRARLSAAVPVSMDAAGTTTRLARLAGKSASAKALAAWTLSRQQAEPCAAALASTAAARPITRLAKCAAAPASATISAARPTTRLASCAAMCASTPKPRCDLLHFQ